MVNNGVFSVGCSLLSSSVDEYLSIELVDEV